MEFVFFIGDSLLPGDAPIEHFHQATQIVLALDKQESAIRGETIYHFKSYSATACPVWAGVNIFFFLIELGCDSTTPVSNFPTAQRF